jgi:hypothetical protein
MNPPSQQLVQRAAAGFTLPAAQTPATMMSPASLPNQGSAGRTAGSAASQRQRAHATGDPGGTPARRRRSRLVRGHKFRARRAVEVRFWFAATAAVWRGDLRPLLSAESNGALTGVADHRRDLRYRVISTALRTAASGVSRRRQAVQVPRPARWTATVDACGPTSKCSVRARPGRLRIYGADTGLEGRLCGSGPGQRDAQCNDEC